MDKSYYNMDVPVTEDVLNELRSLGMAASIEKAKSGMASPEFVEAVRRFYPAAVEGVDAAQAPPTNPMADQIPEGGGGIGPAISGGVSPAPPPMPPGGGGALGRALGGGPGGPMAGGAESTISAGGYEPGSGMERAPGRAQEVAQMNPVAHAVQNALGMINPQHNAIRAAVPGSGDQDPRPQDAGVEHPMDRSLLSKMLGITSGQQNAAPAPQPEIANPMDRSLISKLLGRTTGQQNAAAPNSAGAPVDPQAIARKLMQNTASGGRQM